MTMRKYGRRKMQQSKKLELDGRTHQDEELRLNSRSVKQKLEKAKKVQKKCNVPSTSHLVSWKKRVAVNMSLVSKNLRNIELSNSDCKSTTTKKTYLCNNNSKWTLLFWNFLQRFLAPQNPQNFNQTIYLHCYIIWLLKI